MGPDLLSSTPHFTCMSSSRSAICTHFDSGRCSATPVNYRGRGASIGPGPEVLSSNPSVYLPFFKLTCNLPSCYDESNSAPFSAVDSAPIFVPASPLSLFGLTNLAPDQRQDPALEPRRPPYLKTPETRRPSNRKHPATSDKLRP